MKQFVIAIAVLAFAQVSQAQELIFLKDGTVVKGEITASTENSVTAVVNGETYTVSADKFDPHFYYRVRDKALGNDAKGRIQLALYAIDNNLFFRAKAQFEQAKSIDPKIAEEFKAKQWPKLKEGVGQKLLSAANRAFRNGSNKMAKKYCSLILTKLDGDARGGAALSIRSATGLPIRFITVGEGTDRLETFRPEGLASRILGMGDIVGLVQDFEEVADHEQAEEDARRLLQGQFTLKDFLSQLRTLQRMGPLSDMVEKLPFAGELLPEGANIDGRELKRVEAMILSMTPEERTRPEILDRSRHERVAAGSGTKLADLREMLKRFEGMRKLIGGLGKGGGMAGMLSRIPGLGKMLAGGMPGMDPAALSELGAGGEAPNRRIARAQKAEARRQKRKSLRKHKRRGRRN